MNSTSRKSAAMALAVIVMVAGMTSCATSAPGRRCVKNAVGQDATHVLVCKNGRWRRSHTRFDALKAFMAQYGNGAQVKGISIERNAAAPATPAAPTVVRADNPDVSAIGVTWTAPADNGYAITAYQVRVYRNGEAIASINSAVTGTSTIVATMPGSSYQVTVAAVNSQGESAESPRSAAVTAFVRPVPVTAATVTATGVSGEVKIVPTGAVANGDPIDTYRVWIYDLGAMGIDFVDVTPNAAGALIISGLDNGTEYDFDVHACNQGDNPFYCSDAFEASTAVPFGPPDEPFVLAVPAAGYGVTLGWAAGLPNGRAIDRFEVSIDDGPWQSAPLSGLLTIDTGCEVTHTIAARSYSLNAVSPVASDSAVAAACI